MKKLLALMTLLALTTLTACESSNAFGPCVGAFDDGDPTLVYRASTRNVIVGLLLASPTILTVPAYILLEEAKCPVAHRVPPK